MAAAITAAAPAAIAAFVKTPELSPVKTRLAADIGEAAARRAYKESLAIIAQTLRAVVAAAPAVAAYWAVGEEEGIDAPRWSSFPAIWTGGGGLGDRLARVYDELRNRHGRVVLVGSDSPQIRAETLIATAKQGGKTIIGPSSDGGFYLFASERPIAAALWRAVPYSRADTLEKLTALLADGDIVRLPPAADMDDSESLAQVVAELRAHHPGAAARLAAAAAR